MVVSKSDDAVTNIETDRNKAVESYQAKRRIMNCLPQKSSVFW